MYSHFVFCPMFCSTARGNTTVCGEFNFAADPEAAFIVLNDYHCPVYLACWEFTCRSKLPWVNLCFFHIIQWSCDIPNDLTEQECADMSRGVDRSFAIPGWRRTPTKLASWRGFSATASRPRKPSASRKSWSTVQVSFHATHTQWQPPLTTHSF